MLAGAFNVTQNKIADFGHEDIGVVSNDASKTKALTDYRASDGFAFKPHFGWVGAVEKQD